MLHIVRASAQNDDTCRETQRNNKKGREVPIVTLCEVSTNLTMPTHNQIENITIVQQSDTVIELKLKTYLAASFKE